MSKYRLSPILLSMLVVAPVLAQSSVTHPVTRDSVAGKAVTTDTAVAWAELRSNNGELRGKLPQLLTTAIAKARAAGRTPFLELGATWCGPCQELERSLHQPEMIDAFAGTSIIHLDVNEWDMDKDLSPLGVTGGVMPFIVAIDTTGHAVSELRGKIDAPSIKEFLQAHLWHVASAHADVSGRS